MKSTFTKIMIAAIMALVSSLAMEASYYHLASGGKLTPFETFDAAMETAVDNDTIYLSNLGTMDITITKPIVLIGARHTPVNITISNPDETYTFKGTISIEGIITNSVIRVKNSVNNLMLKNVYSSDEYNVGYGIIGFICTAVDAIIDNLILDRSNLYRINIGESPIYDLRINGDTYFNINNLYVRNSVIRQDIVSDISHSNVNVFNCHIYGVCGNVTSTNCLYVGSNGSPIMYSCYEINYGSDISEENALAQGWIGGDGTAAGPYGGPEPRYSLNPDYPTPDFEKSTVEYDKAGKKLKINVKVLHD